MWNAREESKTVPAAVHPTTPQERSATARIGQSVVIKGEVISAEDGQKVTDGQLVAEVRGKACTLLECERTPFGPNRRTQAVCSGL